MALACEPDILIADEPTTALDVDIQAQILELMQDLQKKMGMAIIMITHDLGVIASMCDEVIVMYAGSVCERGTADNIFIVPSTNTPAACFAPFPISISTKRSAWCPYPARPSIFADAQRLRLRAALRARDEDMPGRARAGSVRRQGPHFRLLDERERRHGKGRHRIRQRKRRESFRMNLDGGDEHDTEQHTGRSQNLKQYFPVTTGF